MNPVRPWDETKLSVWIMVDCKSIENKTKVSLGLDRLSEFRLRAIVAVLHGEALALWGQNLLGMQHRDQIWVDAGRGSIFIIIFLWTFVRSSAISGGALVDILSGHFFDPHSSKWQVFFIPSQNIWHCFMLSRTTSDLGWDVLCMLRGPQNCIGLTTSTWGPNEIRNFAKSPLSSVDSKNNYFSEPSRPSYPPDY